MDYAKVYQALMERANGRKVEGYVEKHHIKPRCLGGSNSPNNLVMLTAREHFLAHRLLTRMHPQHQGLATAVLLMSTRTESKLFAIDRERAAQAQSIARTGKKRCPIVVAKIAKSNTGKKRNAEQCANIANSRVGKPLSDAHRKALRVPKVNVTKADRSTPQLKRYENDVERKKTSDAAKQAWAILKMHKAIALSYKISF